MQTLTLISRMVHIASMAALVGGLLYMVAAMLPALKLVDENLKQTLVKLARKRFARITHPAITLLILSGAWQWYANTPVYHKASPALQALLGTKVLLAIVLFVMIFVGAAGLLKGNPAKWVWLNLLLALIVIVLAVIVNAMHMAALGA